MTRLCWLCDKTMRNSENSTYDGLWVHKKCSDKVKKEAEK